MTRTAVGRFTSDKARARFLRAYDEAMRLWPEPRTEVDVETRFGTVHVHRFGPGHGEPIVLLHGHGANASTWYPQIAALGENHPVYAIDTLDDPGRSVQRVVAKDSRDNAAWLDEVLAGLGLDGVHLVGLSYGGWLTLNQAIYAPGRLASISPLDPAGLEKVPARFLVSTLGGLVAMLAPRRFRPWFGRVLANHALVAPRRLMAPIMLSARTFRPSSRPPGRPFTDEELRSVNLPALVLLAQRSILVSARRAQVRARNLIPGVRAEMVPGIGHGLPAEAPDLVNARLLKFIETEVPTRPASEAEPA
ncbi:alpha/beta fold hydrolase [Nonomuraea jiangxiensis]|uniref:Pimeloyl-ACP methyl ester carboxylesterase n=1 Tax=Nonomuraea jiangxiensis TaxID=633440 RepID=A0A1G9EUK8_9ACTN|nr:alpha/beta fold hydrolase [Nonomuraea jiangxiensis]SDK79829.1 Pimeloyl-ACP methyl ester carboxylesterase [Nonomuraea jiangxiensis]